MDTLVYVEETWRRTVIVAEQADGYIEERTSKYIEAEKSAKLSKWRVSNGTVSRAEMICSGRSR